MIGSAARADDWPQWLGPQRDGVWRESGILDRFPPDGPKVRWRTPIGMGYSGPAVAGARVFVTDRLLAAGKANPANQFDRSSLPGTERVLCLDEATGKILWKHEYDCVYEVSYPAGPRTTPVIQGDKVYTLGTMGDLLCLNAANGNVIWSKNLHTDKAYEASVQTWGFAGNPLIDGDKLICLVGGENSVAVAFNKETGKEIWRALSASSAGYASPVIISAGGKRQLIIWHPDAIVSLDPDTGKPYWTQKFEVKSALTIPTPRQAGDRLLVSSFYNGSMMLQLDADKPGATVMWKGHGRGELPDKTEGLHSIMPTPFVKDGYIYGVCSHGELRCLKADTGERVWSTFQATTKGQPVRWANAFLVAHEDRFFLFNETGDLIIARLTPKGYEEIGRAHLLEPTNKMATFGIGRPSPVVWSHPAFANKSVYARNDKEIVCASLAK
jgi:outer membrane protein assembly factor BamB